MAERLGLSYEQAPPFGVPLEFFLVAPGFLMLAALAAGVSPGDWLSSRWMPATLALTHLLTLGFLGMVMLGAMLQMLPVVLGTPVAKAKLVGRIGVAALAFGTPVLALGLWRQDAGFLQVSMVVLVMGLLPMLFSLGLSLARMRSAAWLVWPIRQAWLGLLFTLALGISLAGGLAGTWSLLDFPGFTDIHAAWGLGGWIFLLVLGFAYQVVPMLQLTPNYPDWVTHWLSWLTFTGLPAFSLAVLAQPEEAWISWLTLSPVLAGALISTGTTFTLQRRRRRKIGDVTLSFWRLGMAMLAGCTLILPLTPWLPETAAVCLGIAFLLGFATSVVNGMLYKIVPFLAWFHLRAQTQAQAGSIPNMKQLLPEAVARQHLRLHASALVLLISAPAVLSLGGVIVVEGETISDAAVWIARAGALFLAISAALLWRNLFDTVRRFRRHGGRL